MEVQVPPISMYHMKRLLEMRDKGVNLDNPGLEDLNLILGLIGDILRENHPELTNEVLEKEIDAVNLRDVMTAIQGLPKNSTAQIGSQTSQILSTPETKS
jgi:hypothetical protein